LAFRFCYRSLTSKHLNPNACLKLAQTRFGSVARQRIPSFKSISEIFLDYVEVYTVVDHHRNSAPVGGNAYLAFCRHSLECPSGAPDIASAVNVRAGEELGGQCIMRIES